MADERDERAERIELRTNGAGVAPSSQPVAGWLAVGCGVLGILSYAIIFTPLAFVCSIVALVKGQKIWALIGFITAFIGLVTSPVFFMLGIGVAAYLGIPTP